MTDTEISVALGATVTRGDIPVLCAGLAELLRGPGGGVVTCDVAGLDMAGIDVVAVEALARLQVTARRHGWRLVVRGARPGLVQLAGLLGLADVLFEPGRQPEQREQAGGVEEVVDRDDPSG